MQSIEELEGQIRMFINNPRKRHALLQKRDSWNMICSSLDVIGDTELAMDSYQAQEMPEDTGLRYLLIYGILQAMFLQQDAVRNLAEALGPEYANDNYLNPLKSNPIRDIRNNAIGHPTKRDRNKKGLSFHYISRVSIEKEGFDMLNAYSEPDHKDEYLSVDLKVLILDQGAMIAQGLLRILEKLKEEDMIHREKFKDQSLAQIFKSIDYSIQSSYESLYGNRPLTLSLMHLNVIKGRLEAFKAALIERGILEAYDAVKDQIELIEYPLEAVFKFFSQSDQNKLTERDANIFLFFIKHQMRLLVQMAGEIDSDYTSGLK